MFVYSDYSVVHTQRHAAELSLLSTAASTMNGVVAFRGLGIPLGCWQRSSTPDLTQYRSSCPPPDLRQLPLYYIHEFPRHWRQ